MSDDTEFLIVELVGGRGDGQRFVVPSEMLCWYVPHGGRNPFGTLPDSPPLPDPMPDTDVYDRSDFIFVHTALVRQFADPGFCDFMLRSGKGLTHFHLRQQNG